MNRIISGVLCLIFVLTLASFAIADEAPPKIAFSGRIFEAGCGYSAVPQTVNVSLWTAASGGSQIGSTFSIPNTALTDGVINVVLTNPLVQSVLSHQTSSGPVYIQFHMATSGWTSDRRELMSVPYALTCTEANSIGGLTLAGLDSRYDALYGDMSGDYITLQPDSGAVKDDGNIYIDGWISADMNVTSARFIDINNSSFYVDPASTSYVNDMRADIYYDRNDTNYYANPAGTSYFNDFRPNIIYDRNNSGYYLDPASTSNLNKLQVQGGLKARGTVEGWTTSTWGGTYPRIHANHDNANGGGIVVSDDGGFFDYNDGWIQFKGSKGIMIDTGLQLETPRIQDKNNNSYYLDMNSSSNLNTLSVATLNATTISTGSIQAPKFVDSNSTGFYADPASTSYFNDMRASIYYDRDSTGYYLNPASTSRLNLIRPTKLEDPDNTGYYLDMNSTSRINRINADLLYSYGDMYANRYYDRNDSNYYSDPASTSHYNDMRANIFYDRNDTNYYANPASTSHFNDMRANIYYDRGNTGYYVDPASTSRMNLIKPTKIEDPDSSSYYLDINGSNVMYRVYGLADMRSPIYYDYNNTGYYMNPASTSRLNTIEGSGSSWLTLRGGSSSNGVLIDRNGGSWIMKFNMEGDYYVAPHRGNWGYLGTSSYYWYKLYYNHSYNERNARNRIPGRRSISSKNLKLRLTQLREARVYEIPSWAGFEDDPDFKKKEWKEANDLIVDPKSLPEECTDMIEGEQRAVSMGDMQGLMVAAFQALDIQVQNLEDEKQELQDRIEYQDQRIERLEKALEAMGIPLD